MQQITIPIYWTHCWQNSDMFWKPTVAVEADAASFIVEVARGLKGYKCDPEWLGILKHKDEVKEKANL